MPIILLGFYFKLLDGCRRFGGLHLVKRLCPQSPTTMLSIVPEHDQLEPNLKRTGGSIFPPFRCPTTLNELHYVLNSLGEFQPHF